MQDDPAIECFAPCAASGGDVTQWGMSLSGRRKADKNPPGGIPAEAYNQLKGLILAQNERWRRGLGMQVER